jgi:multidrug efflux pump subunit AcrB
MFAMVLAINLPVDDAIVVVENVERIMSEEGLSPKEATTRSMGQITDAKLKRKNASQKPARTTDNAEEEE